MGLKISGANHTTVKNGIKELDLDISHFLGKSVKKGKYGYRRKITEYFSNNHTIRSHDLRLRLIEEGYFQHKCCKCNLSEWNGKKISLELEHIDGNNKNNNLSNLTILCPNCHSQTSTYKSKNIKR